MNIHDLRTSLDYLFKAQVTPFIWGHAGLGKSTVVRQYAKEKGYKFFPFYLGTMSDVGDILGLASFVKDEQGNEVATKFAIPLWIKEMVEYCEQNPDSGAVILLDEFNRARRDILNGMFSLALDKTFHTLKLPANCHIVAAGNPPTDEYYVTDVNETALMARFAHIKFEPSFNEWVMHAKEKNYEPTIVSFLQEQPELISDVKSNFSLPIKVDNRSWERIDSLFKIGTPMSILEQIMMGIVGAERLVAYKLHLTNTDKPLSAEQVLNDYAKYATLLGKWSNPIDIKSSLLSITSENVHDYIVKLAATTEELPEAQADNLAAFIFMLPSEVGYTLLKKLVNPGLKLVTNFISNKKYEKKIVEFARNAKGTQK